jgi:hypothetical protein
MYISWPKEVRYSSVPIGRWVRSAISAYLSWLFPAIFGFLFCIYISTMSLSTTSFNNFGVLATRYKVCLLMRSLESWRLLSNTAVQPRTGDPTNYQSHRIERFPPLYSRIANPMSYGFYDSNGDSLLHVEESRREPQMYTPIKRVNQACSSCRWVVFSRKNIWWRGFRYLF